MIRAARKKKGFSQKSLAIRLNVSQSYISKVERATITSPSIQFILDLSKVLNVCPTEIFNFLIRDKCSCNQFKVKTKKMYIDCI